MKTLLKENKTGKKAIYETFFELEINGNFLIAKFDAKHSTFNSFSNKYNDDIYRGDVVEIFISTGLQNHYYEIEIAPNNTVFLADIENIDGKFSGKRLNDNFVISKVEKYDNNYRVEIKIPLKKIGYKKEYGIEFNAYRIETDGEEENKHLFALNPTLSGTFHKREFFVMFNNEAR